MRSRRTVTKVLIRDGDETKGSTRRGRTIYTRSIQGSMVQADERDGLKYNAVITSLRS